MRKAMTFAAATTMTAGALMAGFAAPASAAPIGVGNLVNVQVTRVLNNNDVVVSVPINAAANICGVSVAVLSAGLLTGPVDCDARGNQTVTITQTR